MNHPTPELLVSKKKNEERARC